MTGLAFSATVQTSNGVSPCRMPVTEKTSNGQRCTTLHLEGGGSLPPGTSALYLINSFNSFALVIACPPMSLLK